MANETMRRLADLIEKSPEPSPAENLRCACELSQMGLSIKAEQIARLYPKSTAEERVRLFQDWLVHRPEAPLGDYPGPQRHHL